MPQADEEPGPPAETEETLEPPELAPDEVEKDAADDDHEGKD